MKVLLSIKPEFVEEIIEGRKKFEYRKSIFTRTDVSSVVVYATKPFGKVVGEFEIGSIIRGKYIFFIKSLFIIILTAPV